MYKSESGQRPRIAAAPALLPQLLAGQTRTLTTGTAGLALGKGVNHSPQTQGHPGCRAGMVAAPSARVVMGSRHNHFQLRRRMGKVRGIARNNAFRAFAPGEGGMQ